MRLPFHPGIAVLDCGRQQRRGQFTIRILIIDDDAAMTRMIGLALRVDGFDVDTAPDGQAGLEKLDEKEADVIVLDLAMPVMDGRTFYRRLRGRGDSTPVLILSAHGAKDAWRELDADAYLAKPFQPEDLSDRIRSLLDGHG
jgi:two-component system, OmpR family, response regulator MprA